MIDRSARFIVVEESFTGDGPLLIKDIGPWDEHLTVTNDAEGVVKRLFDSGRLQPGQPLHYYDSGRDLAELKVRDGRFGGFAPVKP